MRDVRDERRFDDTAVSRHAEQLLERRRGDIHGLGAIELARRLPGEALLLEGNSLSGTEVRDGFGVGGQELLVLGERKGAVLDVEGATPRRDIRPQLEQLLG